MTRLSNADRDTIEHLIDKTSLRQVIAALEWISEEKAEHVRVNWQDQEQAKRWDRAAKICGKIALKVGV